MRIYLATKWENIPRAIEVATQLEAAGHSITYKWWAQEQVSAEQAKADMNGVTSADALVFIADEGFKFQGALVEFGMAAACHLPIHVIGNAIDRCIFMKLPNVHRGIETLLQATHTTV